MRNVLALIALLIAIGAATGAACDQWQPLGGGCTSTNFPGPGACPGSPAPTPTPTPTPSPTPTAWPHAPTMAYVGQFGGLGMSTAQLDGSVTFAEYTIQNPSGTPLPVANCTVCLPVLYFDVVKVDKSVGSGQVFDASSACTGSSSDNCYTHLAGAAPHNFDNPGCSTAGDRTTPAGCSTTTVHGGNIGSALTTGWWYPYFQGTQTGIADPYINYFWGLVSDDSTAVLQHATKQTVTNEIANNAAWQSNLFAFFNGSTHAASGPYSGQQYNFITNSLQFGQTGTPNGKVDCQYEDFCLLQFGSSSPNVQLGICEFCFQNGSTGVGGGLFMKPVFAMYALNVASEVDALGKGVVFLSEMECGTTGCGNSGGCSPAAVPDVDAPVADRMFHFAVWFLAYDTNGLKAPNGESMSAVSFEDFNNHTCNANSVSVFDEQFIEPIGSPNVQARSYLSTGVSGNGWGRCSTSPSPNDTHGGDDYLLAGDTHTCAAALNGKFIGVLGKCYHQFSYHGVAEGDICVILNLRHTDYTVQSTDLTGYTVTHTYLPTSTCTQSPNCGDAVTGGTANSQCGGVACLGNLAAGTFTAGATVVPKDGGVLVLTP